MKKIRPFFVCCIVCKLLFLHLAIGVAEVTLETNYGEVFTIVVGNEIPNSAELEFSFKSKVYNKGTLVCALYSLSEADFGLLVKDLKKYKYTKDIPLSSLGSCVSKVSKHLNKTINTYFSHSRVLSSYRMGTKQEEIIFWVLLPATNRLIIFYLAM